jgi:hypothetical protein
MVQVIKFLFRDDYKKRVVLLLPLPLIGVPLLWSIAFYLKVDHLQITFIITILLRVIFLILFLMLGYEIMFESRGLSPAKITLVFVTGFYIFAFSTALYAHGLQPTIFKVIGQYILSGLPALICGVYCAKNQFSYELLRGLERIGLILFPAAIIYMSRLFFFTDEIYTLDLRRLGRIDYMGLSYGLLPLLATSCMLLMEEESSRLLNMGRWLLVSSYMLAIILTQTKGAVVGILLFFGAMLFLELKKHRNRSLMLTLVFVTIFVPSLAMLPKLFGENLNRFSAGYIYNALRFSGGPVEGEGSMGRNFLLANENNGVMIDPTHNICIVNNEEIARMISVNDELLESIAKSGCILKFSRLSLLVMAFEEIKRSPWFGMGPLAFQVRYLGFHPHNILIEFVVELGVVLGGMIVLGLFWMSYVFIRLINHGCWSSGKGILLLGIIHLPMFMVSGTIWGDSMLSFLLGYILTLTFNAKSMSQYPRNREG